MYRGGQNPLDWMKRLKERVVLLHQKDFPATCPQPMNLYERIIDRNKNIDLELSMESLDQCASIGNRELHTQRKN